MSLVGRHIKVSAKAARLRFLTCGPECFEKKGCHGKCCESSDKSKGIVVHAMGAEARNLIRKYGTNIKHGFIQPNPETNKCPFKGPTFECNLHFTEDKPYGCIASPFMLTKRDTLGIRFRYIHLPCYDPEGGRPAYQAFRGSLQVIFGPVATAKLVQHLDNGGGDVMVPISEKSYRYLSTREGALAK